MLQEVLDHLSAQPRAWNLLRGIVEAGFHGEKAVIARELDPWRDAGRRNFLDFGSGTGEFAACFPTSHYVGVDVAAHYVRYARRFRPSDYAVMDGAALALRPRSFDAALVSGVFHHMPDALMRSVIVELHRALKPGATLLVMEDIEPARASWNFPGRVMHWLDRGGFIRSDDRYRALLAPEFTMRSSYTMRSGICDYAVYVMEHAL